MVIKNESNKKPKMVIYDKEKTLNAIRNRVYQLHHVCFNKLTKHLYPKNTNITFLMKNLENIYNKTSIN